VSRSPDWISMTYQIVFNQTQLVKIGVEETSAPAEDTTAPVASNPQNTTPIYQYYNLSINITWTDADNNVDNVSLWHNESGSWVQAYNVTGIATSPYTLSYYTNVTNRVAGESFSWNSTGCDDQGNCGNSNTYVITISTLPTDTCSCPSPAADWAVDCSDDCSITTNCDINAYDLVLDGTGTFEILANITVDTFRKDEDCQVINLYGDGNELRVKSG